MGHFFNVIRHHDGFRLVHPSKWDIGQFRGAFVTDADWCIPSGGSFGISIQFKMSGIDRFVYKQFDLSFIFIRFSNIAFQFHIHFRIIFSKIYSIYVLISYTHSRTHFIYSFMFSFQILIHVLISYTHSCTHFIFTW